MTCSKRSRRGSRRHHRARGDLAHHPRLSRARRPLLFPFARRFVRSAHGPARALAASRFWPTRNRLKEGDAIILDASPIFEGSLVDTSFSTRLGANDAHHRMMMDLAPFRDRIAARVRDGAPFRTIALETDAAIRALGYRNRHQAHLEEVLGHRAVRIRRRGRNGSTRKASTSRPWAGSRCTRWRRARACGASRPIGTPVRPPTTPWDGLWAAEPHLGKDDVGAQWEELLVVQDGAVFWLDDDVPHMRYWRKRENEGVTPA
jgi:hypothetical protein